MSEENKPAETVEAATPAEAPKAEATAPAETPKAEAPKEKKPMDPKKKKNIIIWSCVGGGVLIAGIVAIVLVIVLTQVDYKESYRLAKELSEPMSKFYSGYSRCEYVVEYADSYYTSASSYSTYIEGCKEAISSETTEKIKKLGETSGVSRDSDVKALYDKFWEKYSKAVSGVDDDLSKKLDTYDSWHKFIYDGESIDIVYFSNENKIDTVADYAIKSGNDTLKSFGEQWKTKAQELYKARKDYRNGTIRYSEYSTKEDDFDDWYEESLPKLADVLPLNFDGDKSEIDEAWDDLVLVIGKKYGEKAVEDILNGGSYEDILNEIMK